MKLGLPTISKLYLGSTQILKAYLGSSVVYQYIAPKFASWLNTLSPSGKAITDEYSSVSTVDRGSKKVLAFNGTNAYGYTDAIAPVSFPFTLSAWFRVDSGSGTGTILSVSDNGSCIRRLLFSSGSQSFSVGRRFDATAESVTDIATVNFGEWYHGLVVFESASLVKGYLNGVLRAQSAINVGLEPDVNHLATGGLYYNGNTIIQYLKGAVSDLRVIGGSMTNDEVAALYNALERPNGDILGTLNEANLDNWWPAEEGGGDRCVDHSASEDHLHLFNTTWEEDGTGPASITNELGRSENNLCLGRVSTVLSGGYVTVNNHTRLDIFSGSWTVAWEGFQLTAGSTGSGHIIGFAPSRLLIGDRAMYFRSAWRTYPTPLFTTPGWYKFAITFNSSTNELKFYRDGVLLDTLGSITGSDASWTSVIMGRQSTSGNTRQQHLKHIRIYNQLLSDAEVDTLHDTNDSVKVPIAYWKCTERGSVLKEEMQGCDGVFTSPAGISVQSRRAGSTTLDALGATLPYPGPLRKSAGIVQSPCITLDGTNDYAEIPNSGSELNNSQSFTAMGWVKADTLPASRMYVVSKGNTSNYSWALNVLDGNVDITLWNTSESDCYRVTDPEDIVVGTWYHLAMVYDSSVPSLTLYRDGRKIGVDTTATGTLKTNGTALINIGRRADNGDSEWDGCLMDIRLYENDALTQEEVKQAMNGEDVASPLYHFNCSEGEGLVLYNRTGGKNAFISGATSSEVWANRQDVYHPTMTKGFRAPNAKRGYRKFNGSTQYFLGAGDVGLHGDENIWWSGYIRPTTLDLRYFLSQYLSTGNLRQWGLYINADGRAGLIVSSNGTATTEVQTAVSAVAADTYVFVMAYHDKDNNLLGISVNGGAFVTTAYSSGIFNGGNDLCVGAQNQGAVYFFPGDISVIAAGKPPGTPNWNTLRDLLYGSGIAVRYSQLSELNKTDLGVIVWYDCDDWGKTLVDKHNGYNLAGTGYDNDLPKPQATSLITTPSRHYGWFDRGDYFFKTPSSAALRVEGHQKGLWAAYVRCEELGSAMYIFSKFSDTLDKREWALAITSDGRAYFVVSSDGTFSTQKAVSTAAGTIQVNTDHFIVAYHDPNTDTIGVSIDGGTYAVNTTVTGGVFASDEGVVIGGVRYATPTDKFKGRIYHVTFMRPRNTPIFGTDLSWTAIRDYLYNSGDPVAYNSLGTTRKTDYGTQEWWDIGDYLGETTLEGLNFELVAEGSCIPSRTTNSVGSHHNVSLAKIDFTANNAEATWVDRNQYLGYLNKTNVDGLDVDSYFSGKFNAGKFSVYAKIRNIDLVTSANTVFEGLYTSDDRVMFTISQTTGRLGLHHNVFYSLSPVDTIPHLGQEWIEVLWTLDGTSAEAFVNGVSVGTATLSVAPSFSLLSNYGILSNSIVSGNRFIGSIAALKIYNDVIDPTNLEAASNLLDLRFQSNKVEDYKRRIAHVNYPAGYTAAKIVIPTAYQFGDALPDAMVKEYTVDRYEEKFVLSELDV